MNGQLTITITWSQIATLLGGLLGGFLIMGAFTYHMDRCFNRLLSEMNKGFDAVDKCLDDLHGGSA